MSLKLIIFSSFFLVAYTLSAQTFTEATNTPFIGVEQGSIAFADVDGDNDQDILITGDTSLATPITKLYINDGQGNFTEVKGSPFIGVEQSSIAFADVDGDNDQDLLITGADTSSYPTPSYISNLYTNDGQGNFAKADSTPFEGVEFSSIAFADVDGDNDQDILITGRSNNNTSKLYTNDGQGNFSEVMSTPFKGVTTSSIAFADVDGDNDQDILITGKVNSYNSIAKLYINSGQGKFSEAAGIPFDNVWRGSISFADVDGDNDKDVLITGDSSSSSNSHPISKLYINDGQGNFSKADDTPFEGVTTSSIAFADVDGDNDQDVLITGQNSSYNEISKLYINDGQGNFTEATGTSFEGVEYSNIAFADVDGDNDQDILITGKNDLDEYISKIYINNTNIQSTYDLNTTSSLDVAVYPNPTQINHLHLKYTALETGPVHVNVYDLSGLLVNQKKDFAQRTGRDRLTIDLKSLMQGTYIIELLHSKQKAFGKFTVH